MKEDEPKKDQSESKTEEGVEKKETFDVPVPPTIEDSDDDDVLIGDKRPSRRDRDRKSSSSRRRDRSRDRGSRRHRSRSKSRHRSSKTSSSKRSSHKKEEDKKKETEETTENTETKKEENTDETTEKEENNNKEKEGSDDSKTEEKEKDNKKRRHRSRSKSKSRSSRRRRSRSRSRRRRSGRRRRSRSRRSRRRRSRSSSSSRSRSRRRSRRHRSRSSSSSRSRSRSRSKRRGGKSSSSSNFSTVPQTAKLTEIESAHQASLRDAQSTMLRMQEIMQRTTNLGMINTKHQRELYIGNVPADVSLFQLQAFLNRILFESGTSKTEQCVRGGWMNTDGDPHYGFIEFESKEVSDKAEVVLQGVQLGDNNLKIGRPKNYQPPPIAGEAPSAFGFMGMPISVNTLQQANSAAMNPAMGGMGAMGMPGAMPGMGMPGMVPGAMGMPGMGMPGMAGGAMQGAAPVAAAAVQMLPPPPKVAIVTVKNVPEYFDDASLKELFSSFGVIEKCTCDKETKIGTLTFTNPSDGEKVVKTMNNYKLGSEVLEVTCEIPEPVAQPAPVAPQAAVQPPMVGTGGMPMGMMNPMMNAPIEPPSAKIRLEGLCLPEELEDDEEYKDIMQDIKEEVAKYGVIVEFSLPRAKDGHSGALGHAFVTYTSPNEGQACMDAMRGRKFDGRPVIVRFER